MRCSVSEWRSECRSSVRVLVVYDGGTAFKTVRFEVEVLASFLLGGGQVVVSERTRPLIFSDQLCWVMI